MSISRILIANRGEIAIRIARASADLGIPTVAIYSTDDSKSLHLLAADEACSLDETGPSAYMDIEQIISLARSTSCDAIHPGYGFLSESSAFARQCADAGIKFIGPGPDILELFGNKVAARSLAKLCNVPLVPGTPGAATVEEAQAFLASLGPDAAIMIKAISGGGGRGIRTAHNSDELNEAFARCQSEARTAFGTDGVYVEQLIRKPRHVEVQIIGDGQAVIHLGERDCTLQRRSQKLVEVTPCPTLSSKLREEITGAALRMAQEAHYLSLGTFEFLVEDAVAGKSGFAFMEANPRLQVEHTVTEEITGIDLVKTQIEIADGKSLSDLDLARNAERPSFYAMQLRINTETMDASGSPIPTCGTLRVYEVPSGPGIRVDGYGYGGYTTNPVFDSLLAKLIVTSRSSHYEDVVIKAQRSLAEFRIEGIETNIPFLMNLLSQPAIARNEVYAHFIEDNAASLDRMTKNTRKRFFEIGTSDSGQPNPRGIRLIAPPGTVPVEAPMRGCVVNIDVMEGDPVTVGQKLVVLESMKMEHVIIADRSGYVRAVCVVPGESVAIGDPLIFLEETEVTAVASATEETINLDAIRPDLAEVMKRHGFTRDENRPEAVARRHQRKGRTARENIDDLCDPGSFIEYGALIIAAQRSRRPLEDLIERTPADGLITGIGSVNASSFGDENARCMVMAYDYTVLAGTQGLMGHKKMDRMLHIANTWRLPTVLFAEGGGGRPGDADANAVAGLDLTTFSRFASLSGKVPLIGIVAGPCFAGNAALLGCCDVIIATKNSNIGMGGPAMIEGGGLGVVKPEEVGPIGVQTQNGVVDIPVADEAEAVAVTRKYVSYFQGTLPKWEAADQRRLRWLIPENRLRVYDIRSAIEMLADSDSVLELRRQFGPGMITSLVRIEGRPFGVIANDPKHMSGAIEAEGADKAARFMQLCNVHRLPIISLCDTPGFMVGPDIEVRAQVRHVCRMFVVGAKVTVPFFTVVLRKGYGLGAMAMSAGGFRESFFTASWPTGEFGAMGLEGAVKHGFRKELDAIQDPAEREKTYKLFVEQAYSTGKAMNIASYMEIDAVIDPAETRQWIMRGLKSAPQTSKGEPNGPFIDPW